MGGSSSVRKAVLLSYTTVAFGVVSGLLYTPWMIRTLGTADFAIYSLLLSVISLVAVDMGLGSATARFLSLYIARDDKQGEQRLLTAIMRVFLLLTVVFAAALTIIYAFTPELYASLDGEQVTMFRRVLLIYGLYSVISFPFGPLDGILLANERLVQLKALGLLQKALTVGLMVAALLLGFGLYGVVAANVAGGTLVTVLKLRAALASTTTRPKRGRQPRSVLRSVLGFSVWTTVISVSQRLIINVQPSILAAFSGAQAVAIFSIATTIEGYIFAVASGINGLLLPRVTRLTVEPDGGRDRIQAMLERVGRWQLYLLGTIAFGFVLLGDQFMTLWVGHELARSYPVAVIIVIPAVVIASLNVAETALIATGRIRKVAIASLIASALSLPLSVVLVSYWNALGAAVAVFAGTLIGRIIYVSYVYQRHLGLSMGRFYLVVYGKTIPLLVVATLIAWGIGSFVPGDGWISLVGRGVIFVALTAAILYVFALEPGERQRLLPRRAR